MKNSENISPNMKDKGVGVKKSKNKFKNMEQMEGKISKSKMGANGSNKAAEKKKLLSESESEESESDDDDNDDDDEIPEDDFENVSKLSL